MGDLILGEQAANLSNNNNASQSHKNLKGPGQDSFKAFYAIPAYRDS